MIEFGVKLAKLAALGIAVALTLILRRSLAAPKPIA